VRKVVGYRRFETTGELRLLNEIYGVLRLYKNFCLPTIRLQSKTRVEGRIKRICEPLHALSTADGIGSDRPEDEAAIAPGV